jgi:signal transduction histidine kinase
VNPFQNVGTRLALALVVVVAAALTIVYLIVVPSYRNAIVDSKLNTLERGLQTAIQHGPEQYELWQQWVDITAQPTTDARVVVFSYDPQSKLLVAFADSQPGDARDVQSDSVALRALQHDTVARGTVSRNGNEFAEVAYPLGTAFGSNLVVLASSSLHDQLATVAVVRRRVFLAGALAIGFSALAGYVLAGMFARRLRRLEQAAERIAGGRFDEPVIDAGADEVGQLARAFERMRLRLARLDRARGEFIANASHELRTPLFSLAGFLELLDDEELDAATRAEFMAEVRTQVERLTKLATDLLDLSRVDAGRLGVVAETLDLAELAEDVAAEFRPRAAASDHLLEVAADVPVPAQGDTERVLQVARTLVENAIIHTPPRTTVRVSAALDGGRATLTVADDGPGIPREAQNQVFERFYRLDGSIASGSGLGLAIAREVAQLMDGRIELESGNGWTLFTLVLAAAAPDREAALLA